MHNGAEAAGEGLRELGTVDGVADGLTHFGKGGGTKVAAEAELTVTGAVVMGFSELACTFVNKLQGSLGFVTAGDAGDDVDFALEELVVLGFADNLYIGEGFDAGLAAGIVAGIDGVQRQGSGPGGSVIIGHYIGAAVGKIGIPLQVIVDNVNHNKGVNAVLGFLLIEALGEAALFVLVDNDLVLAKVHLHGSGAEAGKGYQIVVIGIISLIGDGKGVIINELHALEVNRIALALIGLEFIEAFNNLALIAVAAGSHRHIGGVDQQGSNVVLGGDGGAIGELHVIADLDGVGQGAVLVLNVGGLFGNSHHVPCIGTVEAGHNGGITGGQILDVQIGRTG